MTEIDFYTNLSDKLAFACQLAAKVVARGSRLVIFAPDESLSRQLDALLWSQPALGFLPHCHASHALAAETPVLLAEQAYEVPHHETLLCLADTQPSFFSRFDRLLEIVSTDEGDKASARDRYRFYRDRGYTIRSHAMNA